MWEGTLVISQPKFYREINGSPGRFTFSPFSSPWDFLILVQCSAKISSIGTECSLESWKLYFFPGFCTQAWTFVIKGKGCGMGHWEIKAAWPKRRTATATWEAVTEKSFTHQDLANGSLPSIGWKKSGQPQASHFSVSEKMIKSERELSPLQYQLLVLTSKTNKARENYDSLASRGIFVTEAV